MDGSRVSFQWNGRPHAGTVAGDIISGTLSNRLSDGSASSGRFRLVRVR